MKKILITLIVLAVIGASYGYYIYVQPVEKSMENTKADIVITADQLIKDYEANESEADKKYLGKVLEVNGKVTEVTTEEGKKKIILETSNPISAVIFDFDESINTGNIKTGDNVRLKGRCTGYLSDVILVQSSIIK
ncbi:MAG: hypothetical protein WAT91_08200 [Saprospiraceae bacterium]